MVDCSWVGVSHNGSLQRTGSARQASKSATAKSQRRFTPSLAKTSRQAWSSREIQPMAQFGALFGILRSVTFGTPTSNVYPSSAAEEATAFYSAPPPRDDPRDTAPECGRHPHRKCPQDQAQQHRIWTLPSGLIFDPLRLGLAKYLDNTQNPPAEPEASTSSRADSTAALEGKNLLMRQSWRAGSRSAQQSLITTRQKS